MSTENSKTPGAGTPPSGPTQEKEPITRMGFRPHPFTLTLAHALYPLHSDNTSLFFGLLQASLALPAQERPTPQDLASLHEKILHMEKSAPQRTMTSRGSGMAPANRYPTISLYLRSSHLETLQQYRAAYPDFAPLLLCFKHALFTLLLHRKITFQELNTLFHTPRMHTSAGSRALSARGKDPFLTNRSIGLSAQGATHPVSGIVPPTIGELANPSGNLPSTSGLSTSESTEPLAGPTQAALLPTQEELLTHLEELLTPPLVVPSGSVLETIRGNLRIGQAHPLFPHPDMDYTPILDKALAISGGQLSSDIIESFEPVKRKRRRATPGGVSTETKS